MQKKNEIEKASPDLDLDFVWAQKERGCSGNIKNKVDLDESITIYTVGLDI